MSHLGISGFMFADGVALLASSGHDLQHALDLFTAESEVAGMRVNFCKSEPNPWGSGIGL